MVGLHRSARRRPLVAAATVIVLTGVLLSEGAVHPGGRAVGQIPLGGIAAAQAATDELDEAREDLETASRELTEVAAAIRRTNDEVAALDDRLRVSSTELARIETELVAATRAADAADADERRAAAELAEIDEALAATVTELGATRDLVAARAVHAFKHGAATTGDLFVRGVGGANDWHEVAVTLEVIGRVAADDAAVLASSVDLTRATATLRADAGLARTAALDAARVAAEERRTVDALVAAQARTVDTIETQLTARSAVLAELEADAAGRAVLVRELERRVAELELSATLVFVPIQVDLDLHGPPPAWANGLPGAANGYAAAIDASAARYGIDGRLLAALVWTESNFRPDAVSHAGALGLSQLMPGTARGLGVDPRDPLANLDGGARYLRTQLDRFGRIDLALAAYNAGPGRVEARGGVPDIVETQLYVVRVLDRYQALTGSG